MDQKCDQKWTKGWEVGSPMKVSPTGRSHHWSVGMEQHLVVRELGQQVMVISVTG